jgi:hypothetical protein
MIWLFKSKSAKYNDIVNKWIDENVPSLPESARSQYLVGIASETEHVNDLLPDGTQSDKICLAYKIARRHIKEIPDYYDELLPRVEKTTPAKVQEEAYDVIKSIIFQTSTLIKHHVTEDEEENSKEELRAAIKELRKKVKINHDYDVPYVAGFSTKQNMIYVDRHFKAMKLIDFILVHECVERSLMKEFKLPYAEAHNVALKAERAALEVFGGNWGKYDALMQKYVKKIGDEQLTKCPQDLDTTPYRDEHDSKDLYAIEHPLKKSIPRLYLMIKSAA